MSRFWIAGVLLFAAACSRKAEPPADKRAEAPAAKESNIVTLDPGAQRSAGAKVEPVAERSIAEIITASVRPALNAAAGVNP